MGSHRQGSRLLITGILWSQVLLLGSCAAAVKAPSQSVPEGAPVSADLSSAQKSTSGSGQARAVVPQPKTQLIKTATLELRVQNVETMIQRATAVVTTHGGDMLGLQDQVPEDRDVRRTATFKFRVPQNQLDATLADLAKLGSIENRSIQAEDVSTQLVDAEARLRNLRKSEAVVLGIMEKSGTVSDVLKVSQELGQIRTQIEQIQAQVQHLNEQVAYSTINLTLKAAVAQGQEGISLGDRLQETWSQSTHAVGETTANLLRLTVWLLVFSPYLLGGAGLIWLAKKRHTRSKRPLAPNQSSSTE